MFATLRNYTPSVIALILANLIPLAGVVWFGGDVFSTLVFYWFESAAIGCFNIVKLKKAAAESAPEDIKELWGYLINGRSPAGFSGSALIRFFALHYGGFMGAHAIFFGLFLFAFTKSGFYMFPRMTPALFLTGIFSVAGFMISHGFSYMTNFIGRQEFLRCVNLCSHIVVLP